MKLFIIGNGFDRGHGLPTQYWDFRTFLEKRDPSFLATFEQHYDIYPNTPKDEKSKMLWNELETNLANIDEDVIIDIGTGIDMGLESGDVGIEDTLYAFFSDEYGYIQSLAKYLKQWVRTIKIRDAKKRTSLIIDNALYITFNYTAVLENVYCISHSKITHIHGSLREYDIDPVIGHGNHERINNILKKRREAENIFDEKLTSICKAVEDYYKTTFKDVNHYVSRLPKISNLEIDEICVIGHSLAGVDMPYFRQIDNLTKKCVVWKVYYYQPTEKKKFKNSLISIGIDKRRIKTASSAEFYDI